MPTYKTTYAKVICDTCGIQFHRSVSGISSDERNKKLQEDQECRTCYAKSLPKKLLEIEITVNQSTRTIRINIINSFDVKEILKQNGFRFEAYSKAWIKDISIGLNQEELIAHWTPEKTWLETQGWNISKERITQKLFSI